MSDQQNNQIPNPFASVKISAAAFGAKYRSKRECYNFLSVDCGVYLPSYGKLSSFTRILIYYNPNFHFNLDQVTIYFLKDLISGTKKKIYGKDVRHISIPQYKGLAIKDIAKFVAPYDKVAEYLPDESEIPKLPK